MHVSEVAAFVLPLRPAVGAAAEGAAPRLPRLLLGRENRRLAETLQRGGQGDLPCVLHFWGEPGVGKSQLLEACCRRFEERFGPRATVLRSARGFAREFARAIHTRTTADFRRRYAELALLAIDDLDELSQAAAAQQELIHLIDALHEQGGWLAVTSDRPPERLPNIDARLRSRLAAGLVLPVAPPGLAGRRTMLALWNQSLPDPRPAEELDRIAARVAPPVELFAELALRAPGALESSPPRISEIAQRTAHAFQLSLAELKGPGRQRTRCDARGVAMCLARELTGQSYAAIGRYFGGRDPATVRHQCQRVESEAQRRADLRGTLQRLRRALKAETFRLEDKLSTN